MAQAYGTGLRPTPGRMVSFFHAGDGVHWPAMVLEVTDDDAVEADPPGDGTVVCLLQVFRPRANEWVRAIEGTSQGQWSWPVYVKGADLKDVSENGTAVRDNEEAVITKRGEDDWHVT